MEKDIAEKPSVSLLRRTPHPAVTGTICLTVLLLLGWWAQVNGLLPWLTRWQTQRTQKEVYTMAKRVEGDYGKLTPDEQKWINEATHGHGAMAVARYGGKKRDVSAPPATAPPAPPSP